MPGTMKLANYLYWGDLKGKVTTAIFLNERNF